VLERVVASMPTVDPLPPPVPDEWFQEADLTPLPKDGREEALPAPLSSPEAEPKASDDQVPAPGPVIKPLGGIDTQSEPTLLRLVAEEDLSTAPATSEAATSEGDGEPASPGTGRWPVPQKSALLRRK